MARDQHDEQPADRQVVHGRPGDWRQCADCGKPLPRGCAICGWCGGQAVTIEQQHGEEGAQ